MIDIREQIKELLESISFPEPFRVRSMFPKSLDDGILITYFELTNTSTQIKFIDSLSFQVDIWTYDLETLVSLACLVDEKLTGIGWLREFSSPDSMAEDPSGYYRKIFRYGRKVDLRLNRLIDN